MDAAPGLFGQVVAGVRRVWPVFIVLYAIGWTLFASQPDSWAAWFRTMTFDHPVLGAIVLSCVAGSLLWYSRRSSMLLVAAAVAAALWVGTSNATVVIAVSFLAARHPRWVRWVLWLVLGALHPLGIAPDTLGYMHSPQIVPPWVTPLLAVALPAFVGSWAADAERARRWRRAEERARNVAASARSEASQTTDRLELSRHMHDIVGRSIARMTLQATAIVALSDNPQIVNLASRIADIGATANGELRTIVHAINAGETRAAPTAHETWRDAVDAAIAHGHTVHVRGTDAFVRLEQPLRDVMSAVVAEALHNAVKHAPGAAIRITASRGTSRLTLIVENGRPALIRTATVPGLGIGTALLAAQVHDLGGVMSSGPTGRGGWRVRAEVPQ